MTYTDPFSPGRPVSSKSRRCSRSYQLITEAKIEDRTSNTSVLEFTNVKGNDEKEIRTVFDSAFGSLAVDNELKESVPPQNAIGKTLLQNEGNDEKIPLPGSATKPAEGGPTISAVLCYAILCCCAMLCYTVVCHAMLCYAILC